MIRRMTPVVVALLLLCSFGGYVKTGLASPMPDASCDRECLRGFITQYLDAMVAHKPDSLPVADGVKFTEDCKEIKLGEGIWKNFSGLTDYRRDILDGSRVRARDVLIGLGSTGLHTNGYSLARKIVFDVLGLSVEDLVPGLERTVQEALLAVHRSYLPSVRQALLTGRVHGLAHITGGGIPGNLPRAACNRAIPFASPASTPVAGRFHPCSGLFRMQGR